MLNISDQFYRQNSSKNQAAVANRSTSLLEKTCDLIRYFPEYYDVVVSVARKTDGRHWADLFSAAGRSTECVTHFLTFLIQILQSCIRKSNINLSFDNPQNLCLFKSRSKWRKLIDVQLHRYQKMTCYIQLFY